jgi:hypothetical protein
MGKRRVTRVDALAMQGVNAHDADGYARGQLCECDSLDANRARRAYLN